MKPKAPKASIEHVLNIIRENGLETQDRKSVV